MKANQEGESRLNRVGAVSYLNTKPLVFRLEESLTDAELVYHLPSHLANALTEEQLEVALVPSIELARHPEWTIISDACIACRGPVMSVKLLFRVPPQEVQTLVLDEGSRTSVVMAQVLLRELYGIQPNLSSLPIGVDPNSVQADAMLIIGDRAIYAKEADYVDAWDLGDRWCRWAELPFVFAMWLARPGVETQPIDAWLSSARDQGCQNFAQIAQRHAPQMKLPVSLVEDYLSRNLYFYLGPDELRGLTFFYERAAAHGFIDSVPKVAIDDCTVER